MLPSERCPAYAWPTPVSSRWPRQLPGLERLPLRHQAQERSRPRDRRHTRPRSPSSLAAKQFEMVAWTQHCLARSSNVDANCTKSHESLFVIVSVASGARSFSPAAPAGPRGPAARRPTGSAGSPPRLRPRAARLRFEFVLSNPKRSEVIINHSNTQTIINDINYLIFIIFRGEKRNTPC